jgi:hypothetical protein
MELALNLGWTAMAIAMCCLWARYASHEGPGRRVQFIALALVLVTMFVVITMYDDMAMAQNPAETRCFQNDDRFGAHMHATLHPAVALAPTFAVEIALNSFRFAGKGNLPVPTMRANGLSSIQNRPPPAN